MLIIYNIKLKFLRLKICMNQDFKHLNIEQRWPCQWVFLSGIKLASKCSPFLICYNLVFDNLYCLGTSFRFLIFIERIFLSKNKCLTKVQVLSSQTIYPYNKIYIYETSNNINYHKTKRKYFLFSRKVTYSCIVCLESCTAYRNIAWCIMVITWYR